MIPDTLGALALSMMLSLPARAHVADFSETDKPRLERIANDIAFAAEQWDGAPFAGIARKEALTAALVALAWHESAGFDEKVEQCRLTGDRYGKAEHEGASVTMWQLHRGNSWAGYKRHQLCGYGLHTISFIDEMPTMPTTGIVATNQLAPMLATRVLYRQKSINKVKRVRGWFNGYASGSPSRGREAGGVRCGTWEWLANRAWLNASCKGGAEITWNLP